MHVSAKELRQKLGKYLDYVEQGETVYVIRNSLVVAQIVPVQAESDPFDLIVTPAAPAEAGKGSEPIFSQPSVYAETSDISEFYEATGGDTTDRMMWGQPALYFSGRMGEFWVGRVAGKLVAIGAFEPSFMTGGSASAASLCVMAVADGNETIMAQLTDLLAKRAAKRGYELSK